MALFSTFAIFIFRDTLIAQFASSGFCGFFVIITRWPISAILAPMPGVRHLSLSPSGHFLPPLISRLNS
jgi:hypothetical protein